MTYISRLRAADPLALQLLRYQSRHLFLYGEDLVEYPIDGGGPEVRAASGFDKMHGDARLSASGADAAGDDHGGVGALCRGLHAGLGSAGRPFIPCDQANVRIARERVNNFLGEPLTESFLIAGCAVVGERDDHG